MMNLQKQFLLCLAVLTVFSCTTDKEWENPFDPESGTEFTAPEITSITATDFDKLVISWSAGDSAYTMIRLERSESASLTSFEQVAEVPVFPNSYSDSGLEFGSTYYYRLLGMADEVEGEYSEIASAQLNLPAPTDLAAEALSDHEIELTWNYALLAKVSRYWVSASGAELQNNKRESRQLEIVKSAAEKSGGESILPPGKGTYQVADRLEKKIDPLAPQREEVVTLPHDRVILLERTWGQRGFEDGFIIERAEGSGEFAVIDTLDAGNIEYDDSNLQYGPTYKYRVCAYADQYKSDYSDEVSTTTTFLAPSDLTATVTGDQSIALSWSDNCSFEDGYELWRKIGSGSFEIIDSTSANGTAYADLGLTYGENYSYKVRAFTNLNVSEYSNADALELAIPKPTALTVLQGDNTAILSWTDNSSFETGFSIEKSVEAAPFAEIGTVASDVTTYTDTDIDAISQYRYRVRAFTDSNYSDYSDEADFSLFTGDIFYISPTGSDFTGNGSANYPYKTIQKGIDVAGDSSLILVAEGTYNESIDFSGKELTVASYYWLDIDTSHISATTISAVEGRVVNIDADGSELLGFTVTSGEDEQGSGIYASDQVTIANCIITGNSYTGTGTGAGIYCAFYSEVTISNCTITGNSITGNQSRGAGVYCGSYTTVNFTDCIITGNVITGNQSRGAGIYASASSELSLSNCVVNENAIVGESAAGAGVHSVGGTLDVSDCDISGNTVTSEDPEGGLGLEYINVTFTNCGQTGYSGPSQSQVNSTYSGTALEGQVTVSGGIQEWTVPYDGTYTIEVWGAEGGPGYCDGGRGAKMKGDFLLSVGDVLSILVGQQGYDGNSAGGGGGTFVVNSNNDPLIIAAGGGGTAQGCNTDAAAGNADENGSSSVGSCAGSGGSNGYGGGGGYFGGGGGGFYSAGSDNECGSYGYGGNSFLSGGMGASNSAWGGFGGGGSSCNCSTGGGGGGGGYSGGGGGGGSYFYGGGGGSYNDGINQDNEGGVSSGHGQMVITIEHLATQGVGIYSSAGLTIDNSTINNNEIIIPGRSSGPYGGGIYATGSLTMTGSETSNNGADGVYCTSSGASYTDITASGNGSYGIYSGGNASFTNITANTNGANGLYDEDGTSIFENCTANSNTGDGIYTAGDGTFSDCTANNNASGRGIWCDGAGSFTTCETDNNFSYGIYASDGSDFTGCDAGGNGGDGLYAGGNSTFFGCTATGNGGGGMMATGTGDFSACVSTGNTGGYGLYCGSAGTFFGCTSGSNGSTGISAGTGSSTVDGCDVTNNGGAGVSIGWSGTFNSLTITGNGGTGISAGNSSTFTDCELGNNAGSGISVGQGTSYFTDITISNSSAGRGIYNGGTGEFVNVTVSGSSGDGIYTGASTSLNNCSSDDNGGYGIWVESAGFLTNCAADGNSTGIYVGAYSSEIINSLATNNSTYGMELMNSSTLIQNCTVSDNGTGVFAGGTSGPAFMNVILYDNTTELDGESGSTYTIDYSDVKGGATFGAWATGSGNIDVDPLFAGVSDYELQDGSPCIDTGNPGVQYNDADGSRNDMGAYGGPNGDW